MVKLILSYMYKQFLDANAAFVLCIEHIVSEIYDSFWLVQLQFSKQLY